MTETAPIFVLSRLRRDRRYGPTLAIYVPKRGLDGNDTDHVLVPAGDGTGVTTGSDANPFLRYRRLLSPYRVARSVGHSDDAWAEVVGILDKKTARGRPAWLPGHANDVATRAGQGSRHER
jgi:hypothetical protein